MPVRNNNDILRTAKKINNHLTIVRNLFYQPQDSNHPKAKEICDSLEANMCVTFADAYTCVHDILSEVNERV